jgi:hypothetical protein
MLRSVYLYEEGEAVDVAAHTGLRMCVYGARTRLQLWYQSIECVWCMCADCSFGMVCVCRLQLWYQSMYEWYVCVDCSFGISLCRT